ncbi:MAG: 30S ribosomal protein S4 [Actinobacteria bacterium]|nr:30S ribosomal protein S4 [Actinomycetota bacterium]MBI3256310.1 30S ribosomal protein S4 [Actinomycetota bacterium]
MARYTGPVCRLCRREKMKLFLKGSKCDTMKCPIERRPYPPGDHGRTQLRRKDSEYLVQLREKQKARRIYGLMEKQFRNLYREANRQKGVTGENLLRMLELRLDNVAFRAGWGASRAQARQLVRHGHIKVNGRRVTIPSYTVRKGDVVELGDKAKAMIVVRHNIETIDRQVPGWLERVGEGASVNVRDLPLREQIDIPVREQLIVELYSK